MHKMLSKFTLGSILLSTLLLSGCSREALGSLLVGSAALFIIGSIVLFLLVVFALLDLWKGSYSSSHKLLWLVIILVVPYLGAILYFVVGRKGSAKA